MIHSVSELQINTFRLLHGKIAVLSWRFFKSCVLKLCSQRLFCIPFCHRSPTASSAPTAKARDARNLWALIGVGKAESAWGFCHLLWPPAHGPDAGLLLAEQALREEGRNSSVPHNARMCVKSQDNLTSNFSILVHSPSPDARGIFSTALTVCTCSC